MLPTMQHGDISAQQIKRLYQQLIRKLTPHLKNISFDPQSPFYFRKVAELNALVDEYLKEISQNMLTSIERSTAKAWELSVLKNQQFFQPYINSGLLSADEILHYNSRNTEALQSFLNRKTNGLHLSDRIWNLTKQFKTELEMSLDVGLSQGKPATEIALDIMNYLHQPNALLQKVRQFRGSKHLTQMVNKMKKQDPVLGSSYNKAMRLARTEVNMAYRASDLEKYRQLDFVLGFEIKRSNHPFGCPVCESLKGKYPKDFQFVGWHPNCRCYTVPILQPLDDFINDLNHEQSTKNYIEDVPDNFKQWVKDNSERMQNAPSVPYWWKENEKYIPSPQKSVLSNLPEKLTREEINKIYDSFDKLFPQVQEQNEAFAFFVQTKGDVSKLLEQPFAKDVLKLLGYDYYGESKKEVTLLQKYIPNKKIGLDAKYSLEDLRKQINHNYLNDIVYNSKRTSQNYFGELQGFNDLGVVVSASDYDKIQGENIIEVFRGVKGSKRYIDDFKYGNLYDGKGIYGNGTYVTTLKNTAQSYGDDIIEMKFDANNVKIVDFQSIKKEYFEMIKDYENSKWLNDCADLATAKGYDMIKVAVNKDEFYYVILNRTKLWIKD